MTQGFIGEGIRDGLEEVDKAPARPPVLLGISIAAIALATLPAAVGVGIMVGSTLPLEFAAAAALTILAAIKVAAACVGLASSIRSGGGFCRPAGLSRLGREVFAAKEVRRMRKLILATLLAATMAIALATTVGAGTVPHCC